MSEASDRELRELVAKWRELSMAFAANAQKHVLGKEPGFGNGVAASISGANANIYNLCADELERILSREGQPPDRTGECWCQKPGANLPHFQNCPARALQPAALTAEQVRDIEKIVGELYGVVDKIAEVVRPLAAQPKGVKDGDK